MKHPKIYFGAAAFAASAAMLGAVPGTMGSATATESTTLDRAADTAKDASITAEVKTRILADADARGINVNVDTDRGHVLLRGTADSESASRKAEQIAESVDGVRSVTNGLLVADPSANPQTATAKTQDAARRAADMASDAWVTTKVKSELIADDSVKGSEIDVSTRAGVVKLEGNVSSSAMRDQAIARARGVEGVSSVDADDLEVDR